MEHNYNNYSILFGYIRSCRMNPHPEIIKLTELVLIKAIINGEKNDRIFPDSIEIQNYFYDKCKRKTISGFFTFLMNEGNMLIAQEILESRKMRRVCS